MATLTSLEHIFSSSENNRTNKNLRDVSFSSYLSSTDEIFVRKLAQSSRDISTCDDDQDHVTDNHNLSRRKIKQEDGEIGVFSAEKYFNGVIQQVDHSPRISRFNIPNRYDHHVMNIKEEIYLATPPKSKLHHPCTTPTSARSESSWNSQNALLQHKSQSQHQPQSSQPESKRKTTKKSNRKSFLSGFGCNICMCSDSGSSAVEDHEHQHVGEIRADVVENLEKQRKSLQVFGSPLQDMKKGSSFRMLTSSGFVNIDQDEEEDEDSDRSSSDLFEIESITGKGNPAPSEASIEWSVVTASAADFSVISDYDDIIGANHKTAAGAGAGDTRRRGGISLGCKSRKAVSVADRIISNDQAVRRVPDTYMPPLPMRFPSVNNKIMEFDSTPTQRVLSLPRSQHNSHLFYIH